MPCPSSPKCVSSDATDRRHSIAPFKIIVKPEDGWAVLVEEIAELPRTMLVTATDAYLHAEVKSALFGFVDDLECHLRPDLNMIALRSSARLGYYDLGVNRKRIEKLRQHLRARGVIAS